MIMENAFEELTETELAELKKDAAFDFEPVQLGKKLEDCLTFDEMNNYAVSARLALATNTKTKEELIEVFEGLGEHKVGEGDDTPLALDMMRRIRDAKDFYQGLAEMMDSALARLEVANANHILKNYVN